MNGQAQTRFILSDIKQTSMRDRIEKLNVIILGISVHENQWKYKIETTIKEPRKIGSYYNRAS